MPVRERTRRAVRAELTALAQDLFATKGYDQTTVDDIAAASGMHRRTFFRYFTSKEDLVLAKYELLGERVAGALPAPRRARLAVIRRAFDVVAGYFDGETDCPRAIAMETIIQANTVLGAGAQVRTARAQSQITDIVRERPGRHDPLDPAAAAIAALSCLTVAEATWLATSQARLLGDLIDTAMAAIRPA